MGEPSPGTVSSSKQERGRGKPYRFFAVLIEPLNEEEGGCSEARLLVFKRKLDAESVRVVVVRCDRLQRELTELSGAQSLLTLIRRSSHCVEPQASRQGRTANTKGRLV